MNDDARMVIDDTDKVKLDILLRENNNIRVELTAMIKNVQNCFFSFLASIGVFLGFFINLSLNNSGNLIKSNTNIGVVAIVISQIELVIIIFSINIQTDVFVKSAYISYIERKINFLIGEEIIFWESRVAKDMWSSSILGKNKITNVAITSQRIMSAFYILVFGTFVYISFVNLRDFNFNIAVITLIVQILEAIIAILLAVFLTKQNQLASKFINVIKPDKDMMLLPKN